MLCALRFRKIPCFYSGNKVVYKDEHISVKKENVLELNKFGRFSCGRRWKLSNDSHAVHVLIKKFDIQCTDTRTSGYLRGVKCVNVGVGVCVLGVLEQDELCFSYRFLVSSHSLAFRRRGDSSTTSIAWHKPMSHTVIDTAINRHTHFQLILLMISKVFAASKRPCIEYRCDRCFSYFTHQLAGWHIRRDWETSFRWFCVRCQFPCKLRTHNHNHTLLCLCHDSFWEICAKLKCDLKNI